MDEKAKQFVLIKLTFNLHEYRSLLEEKLNGANVDEDHLQGGKKEEATSILDTGFEGVVEIEVDHTHRNSKEKVDQSLHD